MHVNLCCFVIQEAAEELKGPKLTVLKEKDFSSVVSQSSDENRDSDQSRDAKDASKFLEANGQYYLGACSVFHH